MLGNGVLEVRSERQCKPGTEGGVGEAGVILKLLGFFSGLYWNSLKG